LSFLRRLFRDDPDRVALRPLYDAIVATARAPAWYRDDGVPDTIDGRFDMVAAILSLVLIRLEAEGVPGRAPSALLAELFVSDMDGQLREAGIGDVVVGKRIGKMMGALGGRLTAYRDARAGAGFEGAVTRNIFRDAAPPGDSVTRVSARLERFAGLLDGTKGATVLAGELPRP
jgi:cytochrome b pre-mRNA-processing protein 3